MREAIAERPAAAGPRPGPAGHGPASTLTADRLPNISPSERKVVATRLRTPARLSSARSCAASAGSSVTVGERDEAPRGRAARATACSAPPRARRPVAGSSDPEEPGRGPLAHPRPAAQPHPPRLVVGSEAGERAITTSTRGVGQQVRGRPRDGLVDADRRPSRIDGREVGRLGGDGAADDGVLQGGDARSRRRSLLAATVNRHGSGAMPRLWSIATRSPVRCRARPPTRRGA